ncbi:MAG: site-specific DNA-methyltransferase [Solirubrobacterales bacterium]
MNKQTTPKDDVFKVHIVAASLLAPYSNNARTHSPEQVRQIKQSMLEFGWTNPILADFAECHTVVAGHGRLMAALELYKEGHVIKTPSGADIPANHVPAIDCTGWSEPQRRAYVLADNKLALNAGWDVEMLKHELLELRDLDFDLGLTGFLPTEIDDLLDPKAGDANCDPDDLPSVVVDVVSTLGDVWICGDHRVMCGDATNFEHVERLLDGPEVKADMVWTDPPYLMDFTGAIGTHGEKRQRHEAITNDKMTKEQGERFLRDIASMIKAKCKGAFYISFYRLGIEWIMRAVTDSGLHWRNLIIWRKNNINLSNSDYKSQYEPLVYGFIDDYQSVLYGWTELHFFRGPKGQADVMEYGVPSVWDIDKTKKNELHPTVKPVALIERSIMNSSLSGQTVLDLFGGSGSTLIACEMTARKARMMELEPKYVDVICRRFHMFTGIVPSHAETGELFPLERFAEALPEQR